MTFRKLLRFALAPLLALAALSLCSCGTVQGFGKDLKKLGSKMEGASEKVESGGDSGKKDTGSSSAGRY